MKERKGAVKFQGSPLTLLGEPLTPGVMAPDFQVVDDNMGNVRFQAYRGKIRVVCSVPSLDTDVCDEEARRFNAMAQKFPEGVVILVVSMDLPFALKRWCGTAHAHDVYTLSDHRDADFGLKYGVLIKELRLLSRAVFLVDQEGILTHAHYLPELTQQPDYDLVLRQVNELKG